MGTTATPAMVSEPPTLRTPDLSFRKEEKKPAPPAVKETWWVEIRSHFILNVNVSILIKVDQRTHF